MIRVAIIDDERLILQAFEHAINWEQHGYKLIALTSSGEAFLESCEKYGVDIAILDIQIPGRNGIELARILKERYPRVITILLTSHTRFEFAKEAIQIKIDEFVLKTEVEFSQILSILEKYRANIESQQLVIMSEQFSVELSVLYSRFMAATVGGSEVPTVEKLSPSMEFFLSKYYFAVKLRTFNPQVFFSNYLLRDVSFHSISVLLEYDTLLCIFTFDNSELGYIEILNKLMISAPNNWSMGISSLFCENGRILEAFFEAGKALDGHFYSCERLLKYHSLVYDSPLLKPKKEISKIGEKIEVGDIDSAIMLIKNLFDFFINAKTDKTIVISTIQTIIQQVEDFAIRANIICSIDFSELVKQSELTNPNCFREISVWFDENIAATLCEIKESLTNGDSFAYMEQILNYINQNYADENISLVSVAKDFHFSYVYMSRVFRKRNGVYFNEYLTGLRIEKAKSLLAIGNIKAYLVAEMVGYPNPSYFAKVFKKVVGISPSTYQDNLQK